MTDTAEPEGARLGDVLDAIVGGMSKEQFEGLAQRTGHAVKPPKQQASEAVAELVRSGALRVGPKEER